MRTQKLKWLDRLLAGILERLARRAVVNHRFPKSILIIKLSAMGDGLCLMPSIKSLATALPEAQVDWLTTARTSPQLFERVSFIHEIILLPTTGLVLPGFLFRNLSRLFHYDLVIDFDQYYRISELIARMGRCSAGFDAPLKGHTFSIRHKYLPRLNEKIQFREVITTVLKRYEVEMPAGEWAGTDLIGAHKPPNELSALAQRFERSDKKVLVLYPGSGKNASFRRWSWFNFEEIISRFAGRVEIVIAGGPDEKELDKKIQRGGYPVHNQIGNWSLLDWAWFLDYLRPVVVGNDGGFLHLAEAVGIPTISIFGPSKFSKWGSLHPESIAFEIDLDCRPCLKNYLGEVPTSCWRGTSECLGKISLAKVIKSVEAKLESR